MSPYNCTNKSYPQLKAKNKIEVNKTTNKTCFSETRKNNLILSIQVFKIMHKKINAQ